MPTVNGDYQSSNKNLSQSQRGGISVTSVERQFKGDSVIAGLEVSETLENNDVLQYDAASNTWQAQSVEVAAGTDTRTDVSDDGSAVVSNVEDINFSALVDVTDDADSTVTVDVVDDLSQFDNSTSGFISDYTVTESDVTQHEGALSITESQISDLSHYTDAQVDGLIVEGTNVTTTYDGGAGSLTIDAGATSVTRNTQNAVAADTSTGADDYYIGVDSAAGTYTITLSSSDATDGRELVIHDDGGNAGTNNITIDTEATETIDGASTATISSNYGSLRLRSDGTNWYTV